MGHKESKRLRKLFRKDIASKIETAEEILGNFLKPKPRWMPAFAWRFLLSLVFEPTVAPPKFKTPVDPRIIPDAPASPSAPPEGVAA